MAKKPKASPSLADPGPDAREPEPKHEDRDTRTPLEREQERQQKEMLELISQTKLASGYVEMKRRTIDMVDFAYLTRMPIDSYSEETIKNVYGGGHYKLSFKTASGQFCGQAEIQIDPSIPAKYPGGAKAAEAKNESPAALVTAFSEALQKNLPAPPPPQNNDLLLGVMKQNSDMITAMLQIANRQPAQPAVDPALQEMLREMRAEQKELRAALQQQQQAPRGDSLMKELEKFRALQEIMGGGGGGSGDDAPTQKTSMMEKAMEIFAPVIGAVVAKAMAGQQGGEAAPMLPAQPALTAPAGNGAAPVNASPQPNPANPTSAPAAEEQPMNPLLAAYISQFRSLALAAAAKKRPVVEWLEFQFDGIPEKAHGAVFQLANEETWFAKIFGAEPTAAQHITWLQEMRNGILARWLVSDIANLYAGRAPYTPENAASIATQGELMAGQYAKRFIELSSVSFHDYLWRLTGEEEWRDTFASVTTPPDDKFIEQLRVAFETALDPQTEADPAPAPEAPKAKPAVAPKPGKN